MIKHVLLVEDEMPHRVLFKRQLKRYNTQLEVHDATNGNLGMGFLNTFAGDLSELLILLDLNMPSMTGLQMLTALYADPRFQAAKVAILTTSDDLVDMKVAHQYPIMEYLVKPVQYDQLVAVLEKASTAL